MNDIIVAIRCAVYNHEPYIRDCLEGFVMQKTNFRYVAIVHDDCSTDESATIIKEYATKYPNIIKPIYETENQYSKGDGIIDRIINEAIATTGAKYIAYCEGDDYWTDPHKLQRQVDFLDSHLEYAAIAENGLVQNSVSDTEYPFNIDPSHDIQLEEAITKRRFPTAGVMHRKETSNGFYETCRYYIDTLLWCWIISKGRFRYENIVSSVYRKGAQGMTVYTEPYQLAKTAQAWNIEILRVFNVEKDFMYAHIAKSYFDCAKSSIRRLHIRSLCKCMFFWCVFKLKSMQSKIC